MALVLITLNILYLLHVPNWCSNKITISGPKSVLDRLSQDLLRVTDERGSREELLLSLERILPTPPELLENDGWFDWRLVHWGAKWDLTEVRLEGRTDDSLVLVCLSASTPPLQALAKLSEQYPEVAVEIVYAEPGWGLAGRRAFNRGEVTAQEDVDLDETIPDFLDRSGWASEAETWRVALAEEDAAELPRP